MLDPLTALSLASNVVQFLDFSAKLVAKGNELYKSADGALVGNAELEVIAKDLQDLNARLQQSTPSHNTNLTTLTTSDVALRKLSEQCSGVAGELIEVLDKLKVQGTSKRRWKSVRQALKGLMKKDEVGAIAQRLQNVRNELNLHILVLMSQLREDLEVNIERLSHGQDHTNELITREHERTRKTILATIYSRRGNQPFQNLQGPPEGTENLGQIRKDAKIEAFLLASLRFPTMKNRFDEIEPAHRKTFKWIFLPPPQLSRWSDFPQWLSGGTGIYWINGKPASGKSTLMRFICDNPQTASLLNKWSQPKRLIRATHFFWNSGTADQRSYEGLLRALLFDILRQARNLIRVVFPDEWAAHRGHPTRLILEPESWTLPRLIQTFEHLFQQAGDDSRFCLFVDGLDEYNGDPFNIINLFTNISKLPNVKLCVSSRPIYEFVNAFRSYPTLRLQDLSFNDIKQYVDDELGANDLMRKLHYTEPQEAPKLSLEIIDKADGVFLWVKLVVISLLRGLRNSDHVFDLQKRLRLLPPSLEDLFSHILGRLEPVYLEQSSRIFQIFATSWRMVEHFTSLQLSFAEDPNVDSLLSSRTQPISEIERAKRVELVDIWLVTRCGGLIEANDSSRSPGLDRNLSYLHRTVRDFLELPQVWSRILALTQESDFNPLVALLQSHVFFLKFRFFGVELPIRFAEETLYYAYQAELETRQAEVSLLDEFDRVMQRSNGSSHFWGASRKVVGQNPHHYFLGVAIRCGLYHYVAHKIDSQPDLVRMKEGCPLLRYAVQESIFLVGRYRLSSQIVELLLHNGSCPNQIFDGDSAWDIIQKGLETLTFSLSEAKAKGDTIRNEIKRENESPELLKTTRIFLLNGAVVNRRVYKILRGLESEFPDDAKELRAIAVAQEAQNNQASGRRRTTTESYLTLSGAFCGKGGPYSTEDGRLDIAAHQLPQTRRRNWFRKLCHLTALTSLKSKPPAS
ncbi:hypothetical protein F5882DRAFT_508227 [Hyaloscypha sp. PMI_1271]|nr:hypothetical protein F5882DRAFT_508227 [Hyaloscypha sp. PMI_1271]